MKFYKNWIYEIQSDDGTITEISLGSLRKPEYSNYHLITGLDRVRFRELEEATCKKYKSWVYSDIILNDAFIKTPKARNQMPETPTNAGFDDKLWQWRVYFPLVKIIGKL